MGYCGYKISLDERTNKHANTADRQPENIMLSPTPSGGDVITNTTITGCAVAPALC